MSDDGVNAGDPLDRDIRRFVNAIDAGYAAHAGLVDGTMATRRRVAELVRAHWRQGGPVIANTRELEVKGLRMRLYRPRADTELPVMLYVHGGGWTLFSIDTHDRLMREYAARAGIAVIGIDYSLSPEAKFPVALEEVAAALAWIEGDAAQLGVDPARILIGGDSAGANLAVAACLLRRQRTQAPVIGMVLNYGAFAAEHLESYRRFGDPRFPLLPAEMDAFWANYVDDAAQLNDPLVAPLHADLTGLAPAFIAIAECDILADCNREFADKLRAAAVPAETVLYEGAAHSFLEAVSIAPLADRALCDQAEWIRTIVAP